MNSDQKTILWFLALVMGTITLNNLIDKAFAQASACESEP